MTAHYRALLALINLVPSLSIAQTENEPMNNWFVSADDAAPLAEYHMTPGADVDVIRVQVDTAGVLSVNLTGIPVNTGFYIDIRIFAEDTTTLIGGNSPSSCWNCPTTTSSSVQLCEGTYFIWMRENSGEGDPDGFNVAISLNATDRNECNNTPGTAALMAADTTFTASISGRNLMMADSTNTTGADIDWYLTYVPSPEVLKVLLADVPVQNQFYLDIEVFDENFNLIARNALSGGCWSCPPSNCVAVLDSGWYYIRIKDDNYQVSAGSFVVSFVMDSLDMFNFNNYFTLATPVSIGTPFTCQIYGSNLTTMDSLNPQATDVDHFSFFLPEYSSVSIVASDLPLVNGFYLDLDLFSEQDTLTAVASNPESTCWNCPGTNALTTTLPSGTYVLRVRDNSGQIAQGVFDVAINAVSTVGMDAALQTQALRVSPNPTNGAFEVLLPGIHVAGSLLLMDATGRTIQQQRFSSGASRILLDLGNEQPGLYLIEVRFTDGTRSMQRVVRN